MADDDDDDLDPTESKSVRYVQRIAKLTQARNEARAEAERLKADHARVLADFETKLAEAGKVTAGVGDLQKQLEALTAERENWTTERELMGAGLTDPEGMDYARHAWTRIPEADRPKGGMREWLGARDKLPKAVAAYLPSGEPAPAAGAKQPDPNKGAGAYQGKPAPSVAASTRNGTWVTDRAAVYAELGMSAPDFSTGRAKA
jgi:hypothetical protein